MDKDCLPKGRWNRWTWAMELCHPWEPFLKMDGKYYHWSSPGVVNRLINRLGWLSPVNRYKVNTSVCCFRKQTEAYLDTRTCPKSVGDSIDSGWLDSCPIALFRIQFSFVSVPWPLLIIARGSPDVPCWTSSVWSGQPLQAGRGTNHATLVRPAGLFAFDKQSKDWRTKQWWSLQYKVGIPMSPTN